MMSPKYDANWFSNYNNAMQNVYTDYIQEKGFTVAECYRPAAKQQFPKTIHGRTFFTEEEYNEAMADFLNGM